MPDRQLDGLDSGIRPCEQTGEKRTPVPPAAGCRGDGDVAQSDHPIDLIGHDVRDGHPLGRHEIDEGIRMLRPQGVQLGCELSADERLGDGIRQTVQTPAQLVRSDRPDSRIVEQGPFGRFVSLTHAVDRCPASR